MTNPQQLSASPLEILEQNFPKIDLKANAIKNDSAGAYNLTCERKVRKDDSDGNIWLASIDLKLDSADDSNPPPYCGSIEAFGRFRIADGYPENKHLALVEVAAASILYGCCREMIATLSGRGPHGLITLPSVTFHPRKAEEEAKHPTKNAAAKKRSSPSKKSAKKKVKS